jgi:flagellar biosynthesis/type III secretory pathway M-ring protein FliF/YscJ
MPTWLIWVIVIIVVIVVVAAVMSMASKRRTEQRRAHAEELRQDASTDASGLAESQRRTDELRAQADLAKAEAERAQEQAATAEQGHQVEQAGYEDKLREADRIDPEVDHKSEDYEPDVWNDQRSGTGDERPPQAPPT